MKTLKQKILEKVAESNGSLDVSLDLLLALVREHVKELVQTTQIWQGDQYGGWEGTLSKHEIEALINAIERTI